MVLKTQWKARDSAPLHNRYPDDLDAAVPVRRFGKMPLTVVSRYRAWPTTSCCSGARTVKVPVEVVEWWKNFYRGG